jgi:hypothetical protein
MGLDVHSGDHLYMRNMQQCDDTFSKEEMSFCFNHPRDSAVRLRSQNV